MSGEPAVAGVVAVGLVLFCSGCMTYKGPRGVADTIEQKAGVQLHREFGVKLGPISTKIATSLAHHWVDEEDFRDVHGIAIAVFEVKGRTGAPAQPITAHDLGVDGWQTMISSRSQDDQLLVLAKPGDGELREMMFVSIDGEEVVVARLKGHLDKLITKTLASADRDGAAGARAAIGAGSHVTSR